MLKNILVHWHDELEIIYVKSGCGQTLSSLYAEMYLLLILRSIRILIILSGEVHALQKGILC